MPSREALTLQESVMNILALGALKEGCVKMHYNDVFRAFQKIYSEKPELFPGLFFSPSGGEPHSNILEDILSSLGTWQILMVENPRYEYLRVNKETVKGIEKDIEGQYGPEILNEFNELAKNFSAEIKCSE